MNIEESWKVSSAQLKPRGMLGRSWRVAFLTFLVLAIPLSGFMPLGTLKVAAIASQLFVDGENISIDGRLIAYQQTPYGASYIYLYDTVTDLYSSFAPPLVVSDDPIINGDKIVLADTTTGSDWAIHYCALRSLVPPGTCGGVWIRIKFVDHGIDPGSMGLVSRGDIVAWARVGGFSYYRFSSGKVTNVTTPVPAPVSGSTVSIALSTNGGLIAFTAKASRASPSYTVMYYNATSPTPTLVDTRLPTTLGFISLSQDTIVFNDNSTTPANRIRYYNIPKNQASPAGTGPIGVISSPQSVSGDRIIFKVSEADLAFDCNGDGTVSIAEFCLRYWNVQNPNVLLSPAAAPGLAPALFAAPGVVTMAISGATIGYTVPTLSGQPMLVDIDVPIRGDVSQDGVVDALDLGLIGAAFLSRPGSPNWNPAADLDGDGVVDGLDLGILGSCFLQTLKNPRVC